MTQQTRTIAAKSDGWSSNPKTNIVEEKKAS